MTTPEEGEGGSSIDPKVLDALGLTSEDIQNFDAEAKKEEKLLRALEDEGRDFYKNPFSEERNSQGFVLLIRKSVLQQLQMPKNDNIPPLRLQSQLGSHIETPRKLMKAWREYSGRSQYDKTKTDRFEAFLFGYALGALDNLDADTAIETFSELSPEGILNNPKAIGALKDYSHQDKILGVSIAKAIQRRIDLDARLNSLSTPQQQAPEQNN